MESEKQEVPGKRLSIAEAFAEIPDPRVVSRSTHNLVEMLVLASCAMVCGVDDFVGIEAWGNERIDWLRRFLKLENGIPSHDTLGRLFGLLDRLAVEKSFRLWVGSVLPGLAKGTRAYFHRDSLAQRSARSYPTLTPPSNTPLGKPHGPRHSAMKPKLVCI